MDGTRDYRNLSQVRADFHISNFDYIIGFVTAILLIFAPLNIVGIALPEWANGILGYLLGTILCFAIYLLELVIFRKKWYNKWFRQGGKSVL